MDLASASARDSVNTSLSCSGVCRYSTSESACSPCTCWRLDTSQELPVYIHKLAAALQRVAQHNDAEGPMVTGKEHCFSCSQVPPISIKAYVLRIAKYSKCSPVCFMMAWSYLKRLTQTPEAIVVTSWTVHRLLITAVMLAAKLMDDKYYNNAFYAKIGGVTTQEINAMELEMLRLLDYRTVVSAGHIKELLMRLDAFQRSGRLTSVLCKKRPSETLALDPALPQPAADVQTSKVARSVALQITRQTSLPGAVAVFKEGTRTGWGAVRPVPAKFEHQAQLSEACADVASVKLVQTSMSKCSAECHVVLCCPDTVAVNA